MDSDKLREWVRVYETDNGLPGWEAWQKLREIDPLWFALALLAARDELAQARERIARLESDRRTLAVWVLKGAPPDIYSLVDAARNESGEGKQT